LGENQMVEMDPPRQVSRRGPGTGPVFRTFKKSASSFSATQSSTHPPSLHSSINSSSSSARVQTPHQIIPTPKIQVAPNVTKSSSNPPPKAIALPGVPYMPRKNITFDKRNAINAEEDIKYVENKRAKKEADSDIVLDARLRGNRGVRTSGDLKSDELLKNTSIKAATTTVRAIPSTTITMRSIPRTAVTIKSNASKAINSSSIKPIISTNVKAIVCADANNDSAASGKCIKQGKVIKKSNQRAREARNRRDRSRRSSGAGTESEEKVRFSSIDQSFL
jgi:hypothetical protein